MGHTLGQWEDAIRARLGDLGVLQLVQIEQLPGSIEAALAEFSKDRPRHSSKSFTGDGSAYDHDLETPDSGEGTFQPGWSRIVSVEWPTGEREPEWLDPSRYILYPADGYVVRFLYDTPGSGDGVEITYTCQWPHPDKAAATDLIEDVYYHAVAALAAANLAQAKALEYARRQSSSVAGELFTHDPGPLFTAAKALRKTYADTVLGRGAEDPGIGLRVVDMDVFPDAIFHRQ